MLTKIPASIIILVMIEITLKEAEKISGVPIPSIYDWFNSGILTNYGTDGRPKIDKLQLLKSIPTVLTVFNRKGGVGKTTLSFCLADYFESIGVKTLLIDFDPQGNLSSCFFTFEDLKDKINLSDYFFHNTALNKILRNYSENLDILTSEILLDEKSSIDTSVIVNDHVDNFKSLFKKYQIVIIDCPPALNTFSRLGLLLANYVLLPIQPEPFSLQGINEATKTIKQMQRLSSEKNYGYKAIINTYTKKKTIVKEDMLKGFDVLLKGNIFQNKLPENVLLVERIIKRRSIFLEESKYVIQIKNLCEEINKYIYEERN